MKQRNVLLLLDMLDVQLHAGIGRFARTHQWHLTVDHLFELPKGWKGHGALVVLRAREQVNRYVQKMRIPVVDFGIYQPDIKVSRVIGDHDAIGRMAAEHFKARFFQHFAWVSMRWSPVHALRYQGFTHQAPAEKWVWVEHAPKARQDDWDSFAKWLGKKLADAPKPLAILTYNDYDASRVLDTCIRFGITVPDEVAILGVDNNTLVCENQPVPLASIEHNLEEIGYRGAELLQELMDGRHKVMEPILIPPKGIVLRQSADLIAVRHPIVRDALIFVKEHLGQGFGVAQVSQHLGISRAKLDRIYKAETGETLGGEIVRQRIAQAKILLRSTVLKNYEIARQTGFCNPAHFTQTFQKKVGLSPKTYRHSIQ
jgi:LacI family transcriptional regulator